MKHFLAELLKWQTAWKVESFKYRRLRSLGICGDCIGVSEVSILGIVRSCCMSDFVQGAGNVNEEE